MIKFNDQVFIRLFEVYFVVDFCVLPGVQGYLYYYYY